MTRGRIVIITPSPYEVSRGKAYGGVDRYSLLLYKFLQKIGYNTIVVGPTGFTAKLPSGLAALAPWTKMISQPVDLVIANSPFGWDIPRDIPVIWVSHGAFAGSARTSGTTYKQRVWRRIAASIEKLSCKRADYVIAVSEAVNRTLKKFYGRAADKVILNAVDTDFWKAGEYNRNKEPLPVCLFVGSPTKAKGYDVFTQIAENLKGKVKFIAALGKHTKTKEPQFSKTVLEVFRADEYKVRELYQKADLLLHPSRWEGCSYVVIEAWSCGVVTLLSPVGHVPEIVQRRPWLGRFVINTYDPAAWTDRVQEILFRGVLNTRRVRSQFRGLAEEFHSLEKWEEEWLNTIQQFL